MLSLNHLKYSFAALFIIFFSFYTPKAMAQINTFPWSEDFGSPFCVIPSGFTNSGSDPWDLQNVSEEYMEGLDHTSNSGCFLSMDDSGSPVDDSCIFESPTFDISGFPYARLTLWWQNSNSTTSVPDTVGPRPWSNLYIDVSTNGGLNWTRAAWSVEDSQQVGWTRGIFLLAPYLSNNFKFRIRGLETHFFRSDLSVDDLRITTPVANDISITSVDGLFRNCPGSMTVEATMANVGGLDITSATINWSVNGALQIPITYSGSLPILQDTTFTLGTFSTAANVTYDVLVWTSAPNGTTDGNTSNDTLVNLNVYAGLNGTYSVGPTGDFPTMVDAAYALNNFGMCGPVTFNVDSAAYNGQIYLSAQDISSPTNTVTFNGNGATISAKPRDSIPYIVRLDGIQYVTFDNFNIIGTDSTYGWGIHLTNGADHNVISNNTINLSALNSTISLHSVGIAITNRDAFSFTSVGPTASFCTIVGNTLIGGTSTLGPCCGISINGKRNETGCDGNRVMDNKIIDFATNGIIVLDIDSAYIGDNDISRPGKLVTPDFTGIYLIRNKERVIIERNRIHNTHDAAISHQSKTNGIQFHESRSPSSRPTMVVNNLLYNWNTPGNITAIRLSTSDTIRFLYNTISIVSNVPSEDRVTGFFSGYIEDLVFQNNIIHIKRVGREQNTGISLHGGATMTSDNNVINISNNGLANNFTGRWSINYRTLASWQTAGGGAFDQNSKDADPEFTNPMVGNFQPNSPAINNIANPISGWTTDIFNTTRSGLTPDPGAIEFFPYDSCKQALAINSGITSGTTSEATNDSTATTCLLANNKSGGIWYEYVGRGNYVTLSTCGSSFDTRLRVFTGSCDSLNCIVGNDDSCSVQSTVAWCAYPNETYYILVDGKGTATGNFDMELTEGSPVPSRNLGVDKNMCMRDSIVLDAGAGPGYTYLWSTNEVSQTIMYNGSNGSTKIAVDVTDTNSCVTTDEIEISVEDCTGIEEVTSKSDITVYPNPTKSVIYIKSAVPVNVDIYNSASKLMLSQTNANEVDINTLPDGIYVLQLTDQAGKLLKIEKLIVLAD